MRGDHSDGVILGDCCISLSHSTTYEPPLYLFPELLPKVPQDSRGVTVWDGVADAIDITNSFWRVAHSRSLEEASKYVGVEQVPEVANEMTTLATMIASNRLLSAGITSDVLGKGQFSSQAILNELKVHCNAAGFSEEEKALVMSNHFLNLLAWIKLREINCSYTSARKSKNDIGVTLRKRSREDINDNSENLPLPSPWFSEADELFVPGRFVSGMEQNIEKRIEALEALSCLYNKPMLSLCSRGQQTDYVVPPGTINTTSPFQVLPRSSGKADFHGILDLQWNTSFLNPPRIEVHILSVNSEHSFQTEEVKVVPLTNLCAYFGRSEGVTCNGSIMSSTHIHIGLGNFTSYPQLISPLQFCVYQLDSDTVVLLNYGRNGIKVSDCKWVLGEPLTVKLPVSIGVTKDLKVELVAYESTGDIRPSFAVKQEYD